MHLLPPASCSRNLIIHNRLHETLWLNLCPPVIKLIQTRQQHVPLCFCHLSRSPADDGPPLIARVVAQHRHNFLHDGVVLNGPPVLDLGVPHALKSNPEVPHQSHVRQHVAQTLGCYGCVVLADLLLEVALAYVEHLERDVGGLCNGVHGGGESLDPIQVFASV